MTLVRVTLRTPATRAVGGFSRLALKSAVATVLGIATAAALASCGGGGGDDGGKPSGGGATSASPRTAVYDPAAPSGAARGRVTYTGEPPAAQNVRMAADPYCDRANPGGKKLSRVDVGADGGVAGVLVRVSGGMREMQYELPAGVVLLDQVGCSYVPRVLAVRVGQGLEIRNSDATLHNVHAMPEESKGFNLGMPSQGMTTTRKFSRPEVFVRIKCDVHPWMSAHVAVLDHPFFAVTDAQGRFRIDGLPAGTYELEAVHPHLGSLVRSIEVKAGDGDPNKDAQVAFTFAK